MIPDFKNTSWPSRIQLLEEKDRAGTLQGLAQQLERCQLMVRYTQEYTAFLEDFHYTTYMLMLL